MSWIKTLPWPLLLFVLNAVMVWIGWSFNRKFATKDDLTAMTANHDALKERVARVEYDVGHLPSKDDLHAVKLELTEIVGELREARADYRNILSLLTRTEAVVARHEAIFSDAARR